LASEPDVDLSDFISGDASFCRMVLKESLRLYPPIASVSRANSKKDELEGRCLEPNSYVNVIINSLHRNAEYWDHPDVFRPERFRKEEVERRHRYAYLPLGAGTHKCIGFRFAIREGETILGGITNRFRIEPVKQDPIKPYVLMTQRPLGGLPLKLIKRN
jgi:cytochrome P450